MKRLVLACLIILFMAVIYLKGSESIKDYHYPEYDRLYSRMIMKYPEPEDPVFPAYPAAGQALFVVLIFDMEIHNGGLGQFFWNCGASYAALLPDALRTTGLSDVADLYEGFLRDQDITLDAIASFRERDPKAEAYYHWYNYAAFEDPYLKLWEETDINQRFLDFAGKHPEIWNTP